MAISKEDLKAGGIHISLSTISSVLAMMPVLWFVAKPILTEAVSVAVAEDIEEQVKSGTAPLNLALSALIRARVADLRKEMAAMEFRRDNPPVDDWTAIDAEDLVDLELTLEAQEEALEALTM